VIVFKGKDKSKKWYASGAGLVPIFYGIEALPKSGLVR
jgi:hypothetical protein